MLRQGSDRSKLARPHFKWPSTGNEREVRALHNRYASFHSPRYFVLRFIDLHRFFFFFLQTQGKTLYQQNACDSLYCSTCFTTVVWTQTCSTSEMCLCVHPFPLHLAHAPCCSITFAKALDGCLANSHQQAAHCVALCLQCGCTKYVNFPTQIKVLIFSISQF